MLVQFGLWKVPLKPLGPPLDSRAGPSPYFHEFWGLTGLILELFGCPRRPSSPQDSSTSYGFCRGALAPARGVVLGLLPLSTHAHIDIPERTRDGFGIVLRSF